jgi:hypothetical protein
VAEYERTLIADSHRQARRPSAMSIPGSCSRLPRRWLKRSGSTLCG